MPRKALVCETCEAGVSEACARQSKGRRGAANGFAVLQDVKGGGEEGEGREPAQAEQVKEGEEQEAQEEDEDENKKGDYRRQDGDLKVRAS